MTEFRLETWGKWYPFDQLPTADEWKAVQSLAPVAAAQKIKRQRLIDNGNKQDGKKVNHPTLEEVASVSIYKSSIDHENQITLYRAREETANAITTQRRSNVKDRNGSARKHIQSTRPNKKKRK